MFRSASLPAYFLLLFACAALTPTPVEAQYFGRNKVQYDHFDFKSFETEHFIIYYYPEEEQAVRDAARMAERWYSRHSRTYLREFQEKKPLIFYANDADFHQTNVIGGLIGEGTGGVTESLKQRVIMPLTGSYAETDHVLGHELIHSFQYDIGLSDQDPIRFNLALLPLWMIEGTAEYLSVGRSDSHTAMWLRDALLRDDLPTIEQLTRDQRYFPYRFGQAYMAYVGGKYGDAAVANLYKLAGRAGVDSAFVYTLGITTDSLSTEWKQVVRKTYEPFMENKTAPEESGRRVLAQDIDAGDVNISPMLSPDGQYISFLSERDLFSINLFVAETETGQVISSLRNPAANPHMDALRFIQSAGSWSPDGQRLAFVSFADGDNQISIFDVQRRKVRQNISVEGVTALTNLAWSPDGSSIAFTGLEGGISDLYVLNLETSVVRQLTNDRYADLQPDWSPDGKYIAFTTDRGGRTDFDLLQYQKKGLALFDLETNEIRSLRPFDDVLHHNPQFSPDGKDLYFISDQNGFKDVYRLHLASEQVYRLTNLATGVSGITALSPAMSVADRSGQMSFSVFSDNAYTVYVREPDELTGELVQSQPAGHIATASILPPIRSLNEGLVGNYLNDSMTGLPRLGLRWPGKDYKSSLQLDYVAPPTIGVAAGGWYGTQVAGGIGFAFSDMLGDRNLFLVAQAQGTFKDIGGQASYIDYGQRINLGASAGHIPLLYGYSAGGFMDGYQVVEQLRQRIFIDQVAGIAQYPFSQTRRAEANAGFVRYGFDNEVEQFVTSGFAIGGRNRIDPEESLFFRNVSERKPFYFFQAGLAFVGDYSFTGFTSPISGGRYRIEISPNLGTESFVRGLFDYRQYLYVRPATLAIRGLHVGNYGANPEGDLFTTQYLGYSYYPGFIRGYNFQSFETSECFATDIGFSGRCPSMDRLRGTHVALSSVEIRIPFLGTEQLGLISFPYLPTELALFADGGVAWSQDNLPTLKFSRNTTEHVPVFSAGMSARVNILGYIVLESYYAFPFQRPDAGWQLGFRLAPGW